MHAYYATENDASKSTMQRAVHVAKVSGVIAASIYALGYVAHAEHLKLLTGQSAPSGIGAHIRFSVDALTAMAMNLFRMMTDSGFTAEIFGSLRDEGQVFMSFMACVAALAVIGVVHVLNWGYRHRPLSRMYFRVSDALILTAACCAAVSFTFLLRFEVEVFGMHSVLQPLKSDVVAEAMQGRSRDSVRTGNRVLVLGRLLAKPVNFGEHMSATTIRWFGPDLDQDRENRRERVFALATVLIAMVAATFCMVARIAAHNQKDNSELVSRLGGIVVVFVLASQVFMLGVLYGKLGRGFSYPVVSLRLDSPEKAPSHPVFLLDENDDRVVVYDRLNFFQIRDIPKTRVVAMSLLHHASPFRDCSTTWANSSPARPRGSGAQGRLRGRPMIRPAPVIFCLVCAIMRPLAARGQDILAVESDIDPARLVTALSLIVSGPPPKTDTAIVIQNDRPGFRATRQVPPADIVARKENHEIRVRLLAPFGVHQISTSNGETPYFANTERLVGNLADSASAIPWFKDQAPVDAADPKAGGQGVLTVHLLVRSDLTQVLIVVFDKDGTIADQYFGEQPQRRVWKSARIPRGNYLLRIAGVDGRGNFGGVQADKVFIDLLP
jgi:hypothetical protein